MNKVLKIVPEACTGCMRCEMACSYMQTGTYQPSKSVITGFALREAHQLLALHLLPV